MTGIRAYTERLLLVFNSMLLTIDTEISTHPDCLLMLTLHKKQIVCHLTLIAENVKELRFNGYIFLLSYYY